MTVRITGLSSGMDVDAMVKTLMKAEQGKKDKLVQQQTSLQWKQEAYRDVATSLVDFRQNKMSNYNLNSILTSRKAEVTGNSSAVAVTSTSSSASGTMNVAVQNVATSSSGIYNVSSRGTNPFAYNTSDPAQNTFTVNGKTVEIKADDTLDSVIKRINSDKDINATVMYSNGRLSITNNATGSSSDPAKAAVITGPGFIESTDPGYQRVVGQDANYKINGLAYSSSTNNVTVNGFSLQLKAATGSNGAAIISTSVDTDKIVNAIKSFITDYNSILDQVNGKLNEAIYRDYKPLTQDQEDAMSDKQAELWESKAKSGLLSNDATLSSMISSMRTMMVTGFDDGKGNKISLQSIGITTGQWTDYGKLVIGDEDKLRKAIESNPDGVAKLFTATGTDPKNPTSTDSGIFTKISATVLNSLQMLSTKAGTSAYSTDKNGTFIANSSISEQLRTLTKQISDQDAYLKRKEDQYYAQFSAMETAMNRYSAQSSAFSSYQ
ncbi:flagellar filament capping protein FliD [Paenibacillus glycinis]|uniref:Flagellar hook-associated protein 2 n=1 Tax=Paenibacillus glycinis TaxID=2697035 RepID=A0ABW9XVT3_9BACL|nr:flagellar filament capping protein FliD [Paenibacillus glycinis]NBD26710.1 flagellar filament capping protein FliD [Paenibacillus glycinis]